MKLYYGTTTLLLVTISENFYGSRYRLSFTERFNAWPQNSLSSNPLQLFIDYSEIVRTNDIKNPKFVAHQIGVMRGIYKNLTAGSPGQLSALQTVRDMGTHGLRPYLAILEVDTYTAARGSAVIPTVPPPKAGSPTSLEYLVEDIRGPNHATPELHLEKLHY